MGDDEQQRSDPAPAAGRGYELNYFARKHRLTREQALDLFDRFGNDRAKLDAAAEALGRSG